MVELSGRLRPGPSPHVPTETEGARALDLTERMKTPIDTLYASLATHLHPDFALLQALEEQVRQVPGESAPVEAWGFTLKSYVTAISKQGALRPFLDVMGGNGSMAPHCQKLGIRRLINVDSKFPRDLPRNPRQVAQSVDLGDGTQVGMVCARALSALACLRTGAVNLCMNGVQLGGSLPEEERFSQALCQEVTRVIPEGGLLIGQGPGVSEIYKRRPHHFVPLDARAGNWVLVRTALPWDQEKTPSGLDSFQPADGIGGGTPP